MDKAGYTQPSQSSDVEMTKPADLDKWSEANRDIWRLVRIAGVDRTDAKNIVMGSWPDAERKRFDAWVQFYESEDDKKYRNAYMDCDFNIVKDAALKIASGLEGPRGLEFSERVQSTKNTKTVVDLIRAMKSEYSMVKFAGEDDDERFTRMFHTIRDVHQELSKKRLVRNLARVLSSDKDGMYPEIPQALSKLIDAYTYATTRVQDVMGRLGLQLSMTHRDEDLGEDKLSSEIGEPVVSQEIKQPERRAEEEPVAKQVPSAVTPKGREVSKPVGPQSSSEPGSEVITPRVQTRGY
jgi:hypothetical protein